MIRLLCLAMLVMARLAVADCCHVNKTTGNDSTGDGSAGAPYATISKAASVVAPGQSVYIGTNLTYDEPVTMTRSGTAGNPITFTVEGGATPTWDSTGANTIPLYIYGASYITVSGLHLKGTGAATGSPGALLVGGVGNHITVQNCEIDHSQAYGMYFTPTGGAPHFIRVLNNNIHDIQEGGIYIGNEQYVLIDGNTINNTGLNGLNDDGIQGGIGGGDSQAPQHMVVSNNTVSNSGGGDPIDMGGHIFGDFYLVENNTISGSTNGGLKVHQGFGGTTMIARRNRYNGGTHYEFPSPTVFYHNTIVEGTFQLYSQFSGTSSFGTDTCLAGANKGQGCPTRSCPGSTCTGPHVGMEYVNNLLASESGTSFLLQLNQHSVGQLISAAYSSLRGRTNLFRFNATRGIEWYNTPTTYNTISPANFASVYQKCGNSCSGVPAGTCDTVTTHLCTAPSTRVGDACTANADCDELPDVGSIKSTQTFAQLFTNSAGGDYTLLAGSDAIDKGGPLTKTTSSGSGTVIPVQRAGFFMDQQCVSGECLRSGADQIIVGAVGNAPLTVADGGIDIVANTITVTASTTWNSGDGVYLYPVNGSAPDVGAFESGTTTTSTTVPTTTSTSVPTTTSTSSTSTSSTSSTSTTSTSSSLPGATTTTSSTLPLSAPRGWRCTGCKFVP